jgi:hypothetical protein
MSASDRDQPAAPYQLMKLKLSRRVIRVREKKELASQHWLWPLRQSHSFMAEIKGSGWPTRVLVRYRPHVRGLPSKSGSFAMLAETRKRRAPSASLPTHLGLQRDGAWDEGTWGGGAPSD